MAAPGDHFHAANDRLITKGSEAHAPLYSLFARRLCSRRTRRDENETVPTNAEVESLPPTGLTALEGSDSRASA